MEGRKLKVFPFEIFLISLATSKLYEHFLEYNSYST